MCTASFKESNSDSYKAAQRTALSSDQVQKAETQFTLESRRMDTTGKSSSILTTQNKYVGTFSSEKEAAITYDFYSICLHPHNARTNFTYSAYLIAEMLRSYDVESKTFNASNFIERV